MKVDRNENGDLVRLGMARDDVNGMKGRDLAGHTGLTLELDPDPLPLISPSTRCQLLNF